MKKTILALLFLSVAFSLNAQDKETAPAIKNWVSGELTVPVRYIGIGIGAQYERMFSPKISVGANAAFLFFSGFNELSIDAFFRFYPGGKTFYMGIGLGFDFIDLKESTFYYFTAGLSPEIGWKIDAGKPGGFFLQPGIKMPDIIHISGGIDFKINPSLYLGMGYAF